MIHLCHRRRQGLGLTQDDHGFESKVLATPIASVPSRDKLGKDTRLGSGKG